MSASGRRASTRYRQLYKQWEAGYGQRFLQHEPGRVKYLARIDRDLLPQNKFVVFPQNPHFLSEPVLSDDLKNLIWEKVVEQGHSVRAVSVELQVDLRRVAAVVRLKAVEKQWKSEGKKLATPYAKAVMEMLPQTPAPEYKTDVTPHESIQDLGVHPSTLPQIFWPVAEAQHFTRVEAGQAFDSGLLPAEERIPHPQLVAMSKAIAGGMSFPEAKTQASRSRDEADLAKYGKQQAYVQKREAKTKTIQTPRWAFKFEDVVVNRPSVGRYVDGVGRRYGVPHEDRKRGQVKIPTFVDG